MCRIGKNAAAEEGVVRRTAPPVSVDFSGLPFAWLTSCCPLCCGGEAQLIGARRSTSSIMEHDKTVKYEQENSTVFCGFSRAALVVRMPGMPWFKVLVLKMAGWRAWWIDRTRTKSRTSAAKSWIKVLILADCRGMAAAPSGD